MRNKCLSVLIVVLAAGLVPGCLGRAIRESASVATGAKGEVAELQAPGSLAAYTCFELGDLRDDMNGQVPKDLWVHLPEKFQQHLAAKQLPNDPGGKTLVLRGNILHYEGDGLSGLVFGDFEEVLVRTQMVDKATGQVLGTANCIGRTTTTARKGVANKADGLAKALVEWIDKHYPKR